MTTIHSFKASMNGGGSRPNQFRITLTFPTFVGGALAERQVPFMAYSASLPAMNKGVASVQFRGREIKWAGDSESVQPWTIQIYNDATFNIRNAFETWSQGIVENETNRGRTDYRLYQTQGLVEQLDRNDQVLKTYTLIDMWPISVGDIALDMGSNDQIESFSCTLDYLYFIASDIDPQVGTDGPINV